MYKQYLILTINNDIISKIESDDDGTICDICNGKTNDVTKIKIKNKNIAICKLCNAIINFDKTYIGKMFICRSKLSQDVINSKTLEYFDKYNKIPHPTHIDKDCKIVYVQIYHFAKVLEVLSDKIKSDNNIQKPSMYGEHKEDYSFLTKDFKIFFTNEMKICLVVKNPFAKTNEKNIKYDNSYFNLPIYTLTNSEKKILDDAEKIIRKKDDQILEKDKTLKSMEDKLCDAKRCERIFLHK